jgi:CubicO group peptidase (beta-lactamase class C family)
MARSIPVTILVLAILLLTLARPAAQKPSLPAAAAADVDRFMEAERAALKFPGASLAIAFKHELLYSKGFGFADLENRVLATERTAFRTASVAKPMTATAVMQLVQQGRIDLQAPIQKYCPAFPQKQWPVTPALLLGHLAGVRHYKPGESSGKEHYFTIQDSLALFKNDPLLHEPESRYLYTTFGYSVLGCAIEGASGMTYEAYLQQHVFGPAKMSRTRLDRIWDIVPDRARGYLLVTQEAIDELPPAAKAIAKAGEIYNAPFHDTSMKAPGGGLLSTAEDLVRFGVAVQTHALLTRESVERMWTSGRTSGGEETGYGLGWAVQPPQEGIRRISHAGNQIGASSSLILLPEVELTYAVMTNLEDVEMGRIMRGIAQILRKHLMKTPAEVPEWRRGSKDPRYVP